jgi:AcrR family transcriptional regulator
MESGGAYPRAAREAVLDAAEALFAARGFRGTSMSDIGTAAGLSRGAPAYFFESKRGVYLAVVRRGLQRLARSVDESAAMFAPRGPRDELVSAILHAHLVVVAEERNLVCILQRDALEGWPAVRELVADARHLVHRLEQLWFAVLRAPAPAVHQALATAVAVAVAPWTSGPGAAERLIGESSDGLREYAARIAAMVCASL